MKAEMGLDERNPSCFLHSYSVVMVMRKVSAWRLTAGCYMVVMTNNSICSSAVVKTATTETLSRPVSAENQT